MLDQSAQWLQTSVGRSTEIRFTHSLSLSHMCTLFVFRACSELDFMSETHHSVSESQVEYIAQAVVVTLMCALIHINIRKRDRHKLTNHTRNVICYAVCHAFHL